MQALETASLFERERNQLKSSEQEKSDRLRSNDAQLRDCLNTLECERRDFFKIRKAY
jgi:hypothetical protein